MYSRESHTAIVHAAASAGVNGSDITAKLSRGIIVGVNISTITGTSPTLTVFIDGKDEQSGTYYNILTSAVLTAT